MQALLGISLTLDHAAAGHTFRQEWISRPHLVGSLSDTSLQYGFAVAYRKLYVVSHAVTRMGLVLP